MSLGVFPNIPNAGGRGLGIKQAQAISCGAWVLKGRKSIGTAPSGLTTGLSISIIELCICLAHAVVVAPRRLVLPG